MIIPSYLHALLATAVAKSIQQTTYQKLNTIKKVDEEGKRKINSTPGTYEYSIITDITHTPRLDTTDFSPSL